MRTETFNGNVIKKTMGRRKRQALINARSWGWGKDLGPTYYEGIFGQPKAA